jgi:hypothetical protein
MRASTRWGRWRAWTCREGRRPIEPRRRSTPCCRTTSPRSRSRKRRRTSTRGTQLARAATGIASGAGARRLRGETRGLRRGDPRGARLPRVHADRDAARDLHAYRPGRRVASWRGCARVRDQGRQLPPAHGANARRNDARPQSPTGCRARGGPAAERGGPHGAAVGPLPRERSVLGDFVPARGSDNEAALGPVLASHGRRRRLARHAAAAPRFSWCEHPRVGRVGERTCVA